MMGNYVDTQIDSKSLLRLSAVLYVDSAKQYNLNQETVLIKIIESIFIGNDNYKLSAEDISILIKEDYKMNFEENKIIYLVVKSKNFDSNNFTGFTGENKKYALFKLHDEYYKDLCRKSKPDYLNIIITDLFKQNKDNKYFKRHTKKSVENIIYKFLYSLFAKNFECYYSLIDKATTFDNSFLKNISTEINPEFSAEDEVNIVNAFLDYDDPHKNKIIFDIATLAFEYCTTISSNDPSSLDGLEYLDKNFYLDTNIIYRVLGINGKGRMKKTITFIKKCKGSGQRLLITDATVKEFRESIDYNCNSLLKYSNNANPDVYDIYGQHELTIHYFDLKKESNITADEYKILMLNDFDKFLNTYNIKIVDTFELNSEEHKKNINTLKSSLVESASESPYPKNKNNALYDAWNFYFLYKINVNNISINKDYDHKFITTDDQVINWERKLPNRYKTICLKPSEWLTFLFRFISTTDDDFKSFVSFLKLNYRRDSILTENTIAIIMNEAAKYSLNTEEQKLMINNMLHKKHSKIKKLQSSNNYEEIKQIVKNSNIEYLEEKHDKKVNKLNDELSNQIYEKKQLEKEKNELEKQKEAYKLQINETTKENVLLCANNLKTDVDNLFKNLIIKWLILFIISICLAMIPRKLTMKYLNYEPPQTLLVMLISHCVLNLLSNLLSKLEKINIPTYMDYRKAKRKYEDYKIDNNL